MGIVLEQYTASLYKERLIYDMETLYFIWCNESDDEQVVYIAEEYKEQYYEQFDLMVFLN
jgi:hypothetical protein